MSLALQRRYGVLCAGLLLSLGCHAQATPGCAATLSELRLLLADASFPMVWEETSMDDGKPLRVSILEKEGALWLEFIKTREGLWAQSAGVICRSGHDFETRFGAEQIRLGPAANWVLRLALANGGKFTLTKLGADRLRIAGGGWRGTFLPITKSASPG
jgi:hypothetical protein